MRPIQAICKFCGQPFIKTGTRQLYCCDRCKQRARNEQLKTHRRGYGYVKAEIGAIIPCKNPECNNTFIKKSGMHSYCCKECARRHRKAMEVSQPKPKKHKSLAEIANLMNEMGYGNRYGAFSLEHPELL